MTEHSLQILLSLAGTFAFAQNGALIAMRFEKLDLVGVIVLGMMTALGGGITRDLLIGNLPPETFRTWIYITVAAVGALSAYFLAGLLAKLLPVINFFDAVGLGLFCVTGTTAALSFHIGTVQSIILGAITAVGGGTIRDITLRRVPTVLTSGLYAVPALAGATITAVAFQLRFYNPITAILAAATCFTIRMIGLKFNLNAPTAPFNWRSLKRNK